ncbi:hypothetical protein chiPu_0003296 [Chiloscyllium punctatum]|uniref:Uncharacterized protein n=1 Tax=Chiloscyllium punctatum TaxID=137246 RepID=A0A401S398_CHIPU|nr:hypothetical protein [Chiloscyllium punctatum]
MFRWILKIKEAERQISQPLVIPLDCGVQEPHLCMRVNQETATKPVGRSTYLWTTKKKADFTTLRLRQKPLRSLNCIRKQSTASARAEEQHIKRAVPDVWMEQWQQYAHDHHCSNSLRWKDINQRPFVLTVELGLKMTFKEAQK